MTFNIKVKHPVISISLSIIIIIIFSLYQTNAIKSLPCNKGIIDNFKGTFVHIDQIHLLFNLYGLYALSRVELKLGKTKFLALILFLVLCNLVLETLMYHFVPSIPCSIGISDLLFGILSYEIVSKQGINLNVLIAIFFSVLIPSLQLENVSFSGHMTGAINGIISGIIYSKISK